MSPRGVWPLGQSCGILDFNVVDSVPEEFTHREVSVSRMAVD